MSIYLEAAANGGFLSADTTSKMKEYFLLVSLKNNLTRVPGVDNNLVRKIEIHFFGFWGQEV